MHPINTTAVAYTDGSCHTQLHTGGWAALILINGVLVTLSGSAQHTTHHCMELTAAIQAVIHIQQHYPAIAHIHIITDSQYVAGLAARKEKLTIQGFRTKKGNEIAHAPLVQQWLQLCDQHGIAVTKVKAHSKNETDHYQSEADKLARKIVRDVVNNE